jgi:epoxyqueuosine reductase
MPYDNPAKQLEVAKGEGRVAAYAWGDDYHKVIPPRLKKLVEFLETEVGRSVPNRWYTDTGPILERELAQRAGLGWIGKNTMLINPRRGSYFLLAEILLGVELVFDEAITTDHCGSCRRCIEACPTNCILEDRTLDAKRCISYLTIEHKGVINEDLRLQMGDWVFGCDVCQVVCPWNERFAHSQGAPKLSASNSSPLLKEELKLSASEFNRMVKSRPITRAKRRGYLRNLAIAAGNTKSAKAIPALTQCLSDDEALVRGHAAWALGQISGADARAVLEHAQMRESDPWVQEEIRAAIKACS